MFNNYHTSKRCFTFPAVSVGKIRLQKYLKVHYWFREHSLQLQKIKTVIEAQFFICIILGSKRHVERYREI